MYPIWMFVVLRRDELVQIYSHVWNEINEKESER